MEIDAALGVAPRPARLARVQHVGEQVAEGRRVVSVNADREVEALEPERRRAVRLCRRAGRIVAPAAIGIDQRLVRLGNLAELRRRHPIARVDVGMEPACETLVSSLDVGKRRASLQAEDDVEIHGPGLLRLALVDDFRVDDFARFLFAARRRRRAARRAVSSARRS